MEKKYKVKGLTCANCAGKIQDDIEKIDGVNEASINLMKQELQISLKDGANEEEIALKAKNAVISREPHVIFEKIENSIYLNESKTNLIIDKDIDNLNNKENDKESDIDLKTNTDKNEGFLKSLISEHKTDLIRILVSVILFIVSFKLKGIPEFIVLGIAYFLCGYEVLRAALYNLKKGFIFDENFLMTIATLGALAIGEYREAVGVMLFYMIGEFFQDIAVDSSRKNIMDLINIRPVFANIKVDGEIKQVKPELVNVGDILVINPGDRVPVDSIVIGGNSSLDQMALTGESIPRDVNINDEILSGAVNLSKTIEVKANKKYSDSTVSKIMELVENSSSKKAQSEKFITKFARIYTPIVVILALIVAFIVPLVLKQSMYIWIRKALIFLVISCPCALVLSIPLGFFGGIGLASRNGILVKGANYLEQLKNIDTLVLDKTGTVTEGNFKVSEINVVNKGQEDILLDYVYLAEINSPHPIAKSIVNSYKGNANKASIAEFEEVKGKGTITRLTSGEVIYAGNKKLFDELNIKVLDIDSTLVHVAVKKDETLTYLGYVTVSDVIKTDSKEAISQLHKLGIKTVMLSGDDSKIVSKIAKDAGIENYFGNLLPQDKVTKVEEIKNTTDKIVAFTGDGLNDTPVLKLADIGISMGQIGSEAAIEASDVVITKDSLLKIPKAIEISKLTSKIVMQNIVFALSVKIIVLLQTIFFTENIWLAIFADVGVALLAVLNATRLTYRKI